MAWSIDIYDSDGMSLVQAAAPFNKFRVTWTLEGPGSAEIDLDRRKIANHWRPGLHRIKINGDMPFGGELAQLDRGGAPKANSYKVSALGNAARLDRRIVRHDFVVNDEAAVIVEALLSEAQDNQFNGNMSFQMGTVTGTTVTRRRSYCVGVIIGEAIKELASIGRGFDWEIDADGDLNIWNNSRGTDTGLTLSEADVTDWSVNLDTSEMLTNVTVLSDASDPFPKYRMVISHFADDYGRREAAVDSNVKADPESNPDWEDDLQDIGHAQLRAYGGAYLTLSASWPMNDPAKPPPWDLGDVWLADTLDVEVESYFVPDSPVEMRCTDVSVAVEAMPPGTGDADPVYWVTQNFEALVGDITDGDPDHGES